jgi:hypothetical protein
LKLEISEQEREDLVRGLQMRVCLIETGDPVLRADDARNMGKPKLVRNLSADQLATVARLDALVSRLSSRL